MNKSITTLTALELRNKDERKVWNVLNPTIPDSTTLGYILTLPGQAEEKMLLFSNINNFANNFWAKEDRGLYKNLISGQVNWPDLISGPGRSCYISVYVASQDKHNDTSRMVLTPFRQ